jgi:hypothetical protein
MWVGNIPSISYIDVYAKLNWLEIKSGYDILYYSDLILYKQNDLSNDDINM